MKSLFLMLAFLCFATVVQAQTVIEKQEEPVKISDKLYKIELNNPAECIQKIIYQKTGIKVDAELIDDGKTILIKNFREGNAIIVNLLYKDGTQDMFIKSPCSLQVITPL